MIADNTIVKSVFLVEDDPDLLSFYKMILELNGWQVSASNDNGLDAVELYYKSTLKPELIMLDIKIPGCSGIVVARSILEINPFQKILFLSGSLNLLSDDPILKYFPKLSKPFTTAKLMEKISNIHQSTSSAIATTRLVKTLSLTENQNHYKWCRRAGIELKSCSNYS